MLLISKHLLLVRIVRHGSPGVSTSGRIVAGDVIVVAGIAVEV